jgi:chromosome partitioning protein
MTSRRYRGAVPIVAYCNFKPGTGKTTSAVWTAHALHERGLDVLLVDTDPAASALKWSDLTNGFPFRVAALPSRRVHATITDYAPSPQAWIVVDVPQLEDHADIARSVLRVADEVVVPTAPNPIEIDRMTPVRREVEDLEAVRRTPARISVLLNRVVASAASGGVWREALTANGWDVLRTEVPNRQVYSQSFGTVPSIRGTAYGVLADELVERERSRAAA